MKKLLALSFLAVLTACGGGGSDGGPTSAPAPVLFALDQIQRPVGSVTLNGTLDGHSYQLVFDMTAPHAVSSPVGAYAYTLTLIYRYDGSIVNQDIFQELFKPGQPIASYSNITGRYTVFSENTTLGPQYAPAAGSYGTYVEYTSPSLTTVYSKGSNTWSLDLVDTDTALFCNNGVSAATSLSLCRRIDPAGHVLGWSAKYTVNGKTLVLS